MRGSWAREGGLRCVLPFLPFLPLSLRHIPILPPGSNVLEGPLDFLQVHRAIPEEADRTDGADRVFNSLVGLFFYRTSRNTVRFVRFVRLESDPQPNTRSFLAILTLLQPHFP